MRRAPWALGALSLSACFGTPTPLAPNLRGSVGAPQNGVLTEGVELPARGEGFARYRMHSDHYWGHPRLVGAIERAAAQVARERPGGRPLELGDLSARSGGAIPGHRSHRSGRDADLLWYVTDPAGAPVSSPGFVHVGGDGLARIHPSTTFVRLDVEREWLLVKALVEDADAGVLWLFCSREVEALLIDYARARGEPLGVVWRAETVLLQPGDSAAHDDHLHLRISCAPDDAVTGCIGGGPYWEWLPPWPSLPAQTEAELAAALADDPLGLDDEPSSGSDPPNGEAPARSSR